MLLLRDRSSTWTAFDTMSGWWNGMVDSRSFNNWSIYFSPYIADYLSVFCRLILVFYHQAPSRVQDCKYYYKNESFPYTRAPQGQRNSLSVPSWELV
jgi:hypothetical protein